eukprot:15485447-Alexandrium_andersonii.AAC.1
MRTTPWSLSGRWRSPTETKSGKLSFAWKASSSACRVLVASCSSASRACSGWRSDMSGSAELRNR